MYDTDLRLAKLLEYIGDHHIVLYEDHTEMDSAGAKVIMNNPYKYNVLWVGPCDYDFIRVYVTKVKEREMR